MPQFIAALVLPFVVNSPVFFLGPAAISATATGLGYLATAAGLYGLNSALAQEPEVPKPEDGKFSLRQPVPSPAFVLGRAKKAADYLALEEKGDAAYHVFAIAGHRINRHVKYYLHDAVATLDPVTGAVTDPGHFDERVIIRSRLGLDAETAYAEMVAALPTIWTNDHRGDGMATTLMIAHSAGVEKQQKRFPNGMPVLTEEIEGAPLYDGRQPAHDPANHNSWAYSENLALMRAWHITHPVGFKLALDDLHWPDWNHAADVCDSLVTNRAGEEEPRYHGGFWFRASDDPPTVGRIMDQAAELVIYETAEGKIGVHAGEFVEPDVRLTADDLISVNFDVNRRAASTVLAVRGRYTNPAATFNTSDAAIVGDPYVPEDDTERTRTVENVAVQRHNHMQRLQTLAFKRANAPRVRLVSHYEPAKKVPYRRFIRVHYPPRLDEAVIEIIGRPKLSLVNLTYEVEGMVVPPTLFGFSAATDEGNPPPIIPEIEHEGIPLPAVFDVVIEREAVSGGQQAAFALASWNPPASESLTTEVEWQPVAGGPTQSVMASEEETEKRTGYLADGVQYRFRGRHWSAGTPGEWTAYIVLTAVADTTAPAPVSGVTAPGGVGQSPISWTSPNSPNFVAVNIRRNTADDEGTATLVHTEYGPASNSDAWTDSALAPGTYYYWLRSRNGSGVEGTSVATGAVTVT
jgi:hypothetical protein